jgi:hypothetical protein
VIRIWPSRFVDIGLPHKSKKPSPANRSSGFKNQIYAVFFSGQGPLGAAKGR